MSASLIAGPYKKKEKKKKNQPMEKKKIMRAMCRTDRVRSWTRPSKAPFASEAMLLLSRSLEDGRTCKWVGEWVSEWVGKWKKKKTRNEHEREENLMIPYKNWRAGSGTKVTERIVEMLLLLISLLSVKKWENEAEEQFSLRKEKKIINNKLN